MFRLMRRTWKYLVALLGRRFEDAADPEIQIEQAIEEGRRQHAMLVEQAAAVIGNQHELEIRLGRAIDRVEGLRSSAADAVRFADAAREAGMSPPPPPTMRPRGRSPWPWFRPRPRCAT